MSVLGLYLCKQKVTNEKTINPSSTSPGSASSRPDKSTNQRRTRQSIGTVKTHIEKLYQKRGIKARRELAQIQVDEADLAIQFTPKQVQVLKGFATGKSLPQLATEMGIAVRTVEAHRRILYKKMGVGTRAQLVAAITNIQTRSKDIEVV